MSRVQTPYGWIEYKPPSKGQRTQPRKGGRISIAPQGQPEKAVVREFPGSEQQQRAGGRRRGADKEGFATGAVDYERATKHRQPEDEEAFLIEERLGELRKGRGITRGRYSITKDQFRHEMRQLYDNHEEFEAVRGELKDHYDRMDAPARAQFNNLQKSSDALTRAWNDGKVNQLEYYRGMNQLYSMAQQYKWKHHFVAPGGQVGDVVDDGRVVKRRTKDGFETIALNRDWAEQNSVVVGNKKLVPNSKGGWTEVDLKTEMEVDKKRELVEEWTENVNRMSEKMKSDWFRKLQKIEDPLGVDPPKIVDAAGRPVSAQEIYKRSDNSFWRERAEESLIAGRERATEMVERIYGSKDKANAEEEQSRMIEAQRKTQQQREAAGAQGANKLRNMFKGPVTGDEPPATDETGAGIAQGAETELGQQYNQMVQQNPEVAKQIPPPSTTQEELAQDQSKLRQKLEKAKNKKQQLAARVDHWENDPALRAKAMKAPLLTRNSEKQEGQVYKVPIKQNPSLLGRHRFYLYLGDGQYKELITPWSPANEERKKEKQSEIRAFQPRMPM